MRTCKKNKTLNSFLTVNLCVAKQELEELIEHKWANQKHVFPSAQAYKWKDVNRKLKNPREFNTTTCTSQLCQLVQVKKMAETWGNDQKQVRSDGDAWGTTNKKYNSKESAGTKHGITC